MKPGRTTVGAFRPTAVRSYPHRIRFHSWYHFCWLPLFFVSWTTSTTPLSTVGIVPQSNTYTTKENTAAAATTTTKTTVTTPETSFTTNPPHPPFPPITASPHIIHSAEIDTIVMEGLSEDDKKFLERVQSSVKTVLNWEDVQVIKACRNEIPWSELSDPNGQYSKPQDDRLLLNGDALFLQRLCRWFRSSYMNWVNSPPCKVCGCKDCEFKTVRGPETDEEKDGEARRVEVYYCPECDANTTTFPRYNKASKLLETRRGRCGEYSNLFGMFCRSAGLETRLVLDLSDHLWTEVWLGDSWVMADGCEGVIDKPSMYEYGWGKKELCYMIGIGNDHIVDVTPRYTRRYMTEEFQNKRRTHTSSEDISDRVFQQLNSRLQSSLPKNRLDALSKRTKLELAELHLFKQATEWTAQEKYGRGRISGSLAWKQARQEDGSKKKVGGATTTMTTTTAAASAAEVIEQVAGFEIESFSPPLFSDDKLTLVVKPNPTSRHDAIIVANTPCAIGENNTLSVVVVDEMYLGTILQSRSFLNFSDAKDFIDGLPSNRIVLINGHIKPEKGEGKEGSSNGKSEAIIEMPRLGGWKSENFAEKGVIFVGQVDAHPDWAFCTTVEDSNKEGHTIVLRTTPEKTEKALRTERQTFPQRVAGRLPDSVMPLKTQLMASEEQKRLAFTAFCKSSNRYSGYTTKQNAPVYLLDSTSYPFQKVDSVTRDNEDSVWNTFHLLPKPLVPDGDHGIATADKMNLPSFDIPLEIDFLTRSLGNQLLGQNNARLPTSEALHNSRLLGLYFSAHWCGPCRHFTPMLAEMYAHLKDVRPTHGLEIVFVSSDRDPHSFQQYFSTMPWQAIPFESLQFVKQNLNMSYGVRGIPSLVILDTLSGRVVVSPDESRQAVAMACRGGEQAIENMLESWLERAPQESREMLSMLELSCLETTDESSKVNEKENEYLNKPENSNGNIVDSSTRVKEIFEQLVADGTDPNAAAARAIGIYGEEQAAATKRLPSGPLNGKAIQVGPHADVNLLDQTFANAMNCNSPPVIAEALSTMLKYLNNAAKEPWTNKYRSFKLSNKVADQITRVEGGMGLLQGVGFEVHSSPRQDFKATIPVSADLDAMTERLTHLLESIATP